jgi:hypothetical protein
VISTSNQHMPDLTSVMLAKVPQTPVAGNGSGAGEAKT